MNNRKSRYFSCGIINLLSWSDLELQISNHHDHLTFILLDKVKCRLILFQLDVKCTSWYISFVNFRFLINHFCSKGHMMSFLFPNQITTNWLISKLFTWLPLMNYELLLITDVTVFLLFCLTSACNRLSNNYTTCALPKS